MPILATSNVPPVSEMLLDFGDLLYCFDCRDWHPVPCEMYGLPWSKFLDGGEYPVGRPCDIEEAMYCLESGQRMSAKGFPGFIFLHVPGQGFGALEMTELVRQPGVMIHAGEWKFGPLDAAAFRGRIASDERIFVPWTPVLLG